LSSPPPVVRFVALYTALYSAFGVVSPFLPAYFEDRGLPARQIALVIGLGTIVRLASGPIIGRLADSRRIWRGTLAASAAGAGVTALAWLLSDGFGPILLVSLVQSAVLSPVVPIADALALSASLLRSGERFEYGLVRGAGSAAFVAGSVAAGHIALSQGLSVSIWLNAVLLGAAALAALQVPAIAAGPSPSSAGLTPGSILFATSGYAAPSPAMPRERGLRPGGARDFLRLLSILAFRRLLLVAALLLGSHALHDTFAVIRWRDAGITTAAASLLWSEQVIAEVAVFLLAGPALLRRLGPAGAAMLAAFAGVVRWSVLGATVQIVPLMLVEPLHGLTFALFHLAGMRVIGTTVPRDLAATAQALYGTVAVGAAAALLTLASGFLYTWFEGRAFFAMAFLCAAAVPLAARMMRQG
jgi:MFS transporter, PPP family, 3-phenylpropionic acid transporter